MSEHQYDFGYGETYRYWLFRADEVGRARNEPGLYAWYVRPPPSHAAEDECDPYRKVFAEKHFDVEAAAALGETLVGRLARHQKPLQPGFPLDEGVFAQAFAVFAPPIYIGRATSIRSRLRQHLRALETALARATEPEFESNELSDTDEESSQFGARIGNLLLRRGVTDYQGLFVKVVYAPTAEATKRVEYLLNRTFHPTLGRL